MSNPAAPGWTKENAALLRQFLDGGTGTLFLAQLAHQRPALHSSSPDIAAVALAAQLVAGYERALGVLQSLQVSPESIEVSDSENYPDLNAPASPEEESRLGAK